MTVRIGEVETFKSVRPDKAQALKVLEEAAEVFGAWQQWDSASKLTPLEVDDAADIECTAIKVLLNECADVIQATCNLVAAFNVEDFEVYMTDCAERNRRRGRM